MQLRAIHATNKRNYYQMTDHTRPDTHQSHHWQVSVTCQVKLVSYLHHLFSDLRDINLQHANLICYAWINIPLVYTQVGERIELTWCLRIYGWMLFIMCKHSFYPGGHHCCLCIFHKHPLWKTGKIEFNFNE